MCFCFWSTTTKNDIQTTNVIAPPPEAVVPLPLDLPSCMGLRKNQCLSTEETDLIRPIIKSLGEEWRKSRHLHPGDYFFRPSTTKKDRLHLYVCGHLGEIHEFDLSSKGDQITYHAQSNGGLVKKRGTCRQNFKSLDAVVAKICKTTLKSPQKHVSSEPSRAKTASEKEQEQLQESLELQVSDFIDECQKTIQDQVFTDKNSLSKAFSVHKRKLSNLIAIKGRKLPYNCRAQILFSALHKWTTMINENFHELLLNNKIQNGQKIDELQGVLLNYVLKLQSDLEFYFKSETTNNTIYLVKMRSLFDRLFKEVVDIHKRFKDHSVIPRIRNKTSVPVKIGAAALGIRTTEMNRELMGIQEYNPETRKLTYRDVDYSPITGENVRISQIPTASCGSSDKREVIILDPKKSPLLDMHYKRLLVKLCQHYNQSEQMPPFSLKELLKNVKDYIREEIFINKGDDIDLFIANWNKNQPHRYVNKSLRNRNVKLPVIPIDAFIENGGECRHHAMVASYLVDRLSFEFQGWLVPRCVVQVIRGVRPSGGAHSWIVVTAESGEQYLLDSINNRMRDINNKDNVETLIKHYGQELVQDMFNRTSVAFEALQEYPKWVIQPETYNYVGMVNIF